MYNKFEFGAIADINAMNMQNLAALAAIASNGNGIQSLGSGESAQPEFFSHPFFYWIRWLNVVLPRACQWIPTISIAPVHVCLSLPFWISLPRWIFYLKKQRKKDNFCWKIFFGQQNCLNIWRILGLKLDWKLFFSFRCCLIYFWSLSRILQFGSSIWVRVVCYAVVVPAISTPAPPGPYFSHPNLTLFFINPPSSLPKWRCNTQQLSRTETSLYPWQPQLAIGLQLSVSNNKNQQKRNLFLDETKHKTLSNSL